MALTKITGDGYGAGTITTADNTSQLTLVSTDADANRGPQFDLHRNSASPADDDALGYFRFLGENDASEAITYARLEAQAADVTDGTEDGLLAISTIVNGTIRERVKFDATGVIFNEGGIDQDFRVESNSLSAAIMVNGGDDRVGINIDPVDGNVVSSSGETLVVSGAVGVVQNGGAPLGINRTGSDGTMIAIRHAGTLEGSISVSGTTVSYNGGHLSRWSQLSDNSKDTSIVKGTVMTNLDKMAVWTKEGATENNEQLNCMAVSSVDGDANVAGVFVNWDDDDEDYDNDMNIAMTGDMVIRIAKDTTVERGNLLMSAGDGTAKPQGEDIVRSKTIAKVTSTNKSHTYDDGTYLVPCVLMAC